MKRQEMRISGSGGQGIITAAVIMAEAALLAGFNVAQTQSYGPEARGGICKSEVVIDEGAVGFPKVISPTFLLALTQSSLDKYSSGLPKDCVIMADASLTLPKGIEAIQIPILATAREKVGKNFVANIVALGAINETLKIVPHECLAEAVKKHIPKGTEDLNMLALSEGVKLGG
ncbi:MAG: 2-oxoacid:acceptor oxidoreductase family protein [Firmicutes bacterium]|nr:2-oxoacid:acceptor oxidoreductase family protein [Bacillota bacterium]MCL2256222.1 2-oxoacid:acceptor oxidoreductase family protein [Bacillota bacterium]